jgi:hypothetical protein
MISTTTVRFALWRCSTVTSHGVIRKLQVIFPQFPGIAQPDGGAHSVHSEEKVDSM